MRILATAISLCAALFAQGALAQPLSQSMAQCAGLMGALATMAAENGGDPDHIARIDGVSAKWRAAAIHQAKAEHRADPALFVAAHQSASYDDWLERGPMALLSEDFSDWSAYCRSLGRARDLDVFVK